MQRNQKGNGSGMIRIMKYGEVSSGDIFARSMPTVNVEDTVAEIIRNVR